MWDPRFLCKLSLNLSWVLSDVSIRCRGFSAVNFRTPITDGSETKCVVAISSCLQQLLFTLFIIIYFSFHSFLPSYASDKGNFRVSETGVNQSLASWLDTPTPENGQVFLEPPLGKKECCFPGPSTCVTLTMIVVRRCVTQHCWEG